MAVRSRRFFGPTVIAVANAWVQVYVVPAGRTARFSLLDVVVLVGANTKHYLGVGAAGAERVLGVETTAVDHVFHYGGGLVLNPGDRLSINAGSANSHSVTGCGSLLFGEPE